MDTKSRGRSNGIEEEWGREKDGEEEIKYYAVYIYRVTQEIQSPSSLPSVWTVSVCTHMCVDSKNVSLRCMPSWTDLQGTARRVLLPTPGAEVLALNCRITYESCKLSSSARPSTRQFPWASRCLATAARKT